MRRRSRQALQMLALMFGAPTVFAGSTPQWTWEAGKQTNNGAITIKSINGSTTYTGTQNPTASAVRVNQNAATQPPTIVIPSGGINRWSLYYADRSQGLP